MVYPGDSSEQSGSDLFSTKRDDFVLICGRMEGQGVPDDKVLFRDLTLFNVISSRFYGALGKVVGEKEGGTWQQWHQSLYPVETGQAGVLPEKKAGRWGVPVVAQW